MRAAILTSLAMTIAMLGGLNSQAPRAMGADDETVLKTVNGRPITTGELELEFLSRRIPAAQRAPYRDRILEDLIDRSLISAFLEKRKAPVPEQELQAQLDRLKTVLASTDSDVDATLARLGFTQDSLRAYLALPLAWKAHVRRTVTDEQLREFFRSHQAEFDGTQVRAGQIVIAVPGSASEADWLAAERKLAALRTEIAAGKQSFAEAARRHSTSPNAAQGGDLGLVPFRGRLAALVAQAAFATPPGEMSPVVRSSFGVHLVKVSERVPGDLSLEDVRELVWDAVTRAEWDAQVAKERAAARIE